MQLGAPQNPGRSASSQSVTVSGGRGSSSVVIQSGHQPLDSDSFFRLLVPDFFLVVVFFVDAKGLSGASVFLVLVMALAGAAFILSHVDGPFLLVEAPQPGSQEPELLLTFRDRSLGFEDAKGFKLGHCQSSAWTDHTGSAINANTNKPINFRCMTHLALANSNTTGDTSHKRRHAPREVLDVRWQMSDVKGLVLLHSSFTTAVSHLTSAI